MLFDRLDSVVELRKGKNDLCLLFSKSSEVIFLLPMVLLTKMRRILSDFWHSSEQNTRMHEPGGYGKPRTSK